MCARVHECIYACTGNDLDVLTHWHVGLAWASAQGIFVHAFGCCKATMGRRAPERTPPSPSRVPTAGPRTNREALSAASATHGVRAGTSHARGRARLDGREIAVPRGVVQPAALDQPCSGVHRECRVVPGRRGRRPTQPRRPNRGRSRLTAAGSTCCRDERNRQQQDTRASRPRSHVGRNADVVCRRKLFSALELEPEGRSFLCPVQNS